MTTCTFVLLSRTNTWIIIELKNVLGRLIQAIKSSKLEYCMSLSGLIANLGALNVFEFAPVPTVSSTITTLLTSIPLIIGFSTKASHSSCLSQVHDLLLFVFSFFKYGTVYGYTRTRYAYAYAVSTKRRKDYPDYRVVWVLPGVSCYNLHSGSSQV